MMSNKWRNKPWDELVSAFCTTRLGRLLSSHPVILPSIFGILTAPMLAWYFSEPFTVDRLLLWCIWVYLNLSPKIFKLFDPSTELVQVSLSRDGSMELSEDTLYDLRQFVQAYIRRGLAGAVLLIPYLLLTAIFWLLH